MKLRSVIIIDVYLQYKTSVSFMRVDFYLSFAGPIFILQLEKNNPAAQYIGLPMIYRNMKPTKFILVIYLNNFDMIRHSYFVVNKTI